MKKVKTIYLVTTIIFCLFEGLLPALTSHTEPAVEGIRHLGHPDYFRVMLTFFKVAGALVLAVPFAGSRLKEWAYAGFFFNTAAAAISHWVVDGFTGETVFPLVVMLLLSASYFSYHHLKRLQKSDGEKRGDFQWKGASVA